MDPGFILSLVQLCFQFGVLLVESCQHFRKADEELNELLIRLEGLWVRIKHQLRFIERIAHTLDEEHRRNQDDIVGILATKLSLAQKTVDRVVKKTETKAPYMSLARIRRGKYVIQRDALHTVISDLEQWQSRFDPSWFLIMRVADPVIDQELAAQQAEQKHSDEQNEGQGSIVAQNWRTRDRGQSPIALAMNLRDTLRPEPRQKLSVFLPPLELQTIDIPFSNAKTAQRAGQWFIVERYPCQTNRSLLGQNDDVRILARKLASADPWTFGLLNCKGVMRVFDQQHQLLGFDFIFRVPDSMEVLQTLRQNLLNKEINYSLSRRVMIAKGLAKSVGFVHNFNFVHKHICPETILLFEDLRARFSTFLVGFDNFRSADGGTNFAGDATWEQNLYRHPSRQGEFPEEAFKMQHDVYSLGVCLLEIGLWQSFISYSSDPKPVPQYGDAYEQFTTWLDSLGPTGAMTSQQSGSSSVYSTTIATRLKDYFVHLAKTRLPIAMGDKYSAVVMTCLTCLDEGNEDFGDETQVLDEDGILVAVRFIETILLKLNEISV
ncbi:hypothetical protein BDZ45DRAFT_751326 [Acephala macrosclerotiorum]|nr:hypothetical protein BDZ45DRAFT_751326 [Acephala macrosclerotiorum]